MFNPFWSIHKPYMNFKKPSQKGCLELQIKFKGPGSLNVTINNNIVRIRWREQEPKIQHFSEKFGFFSQNLILRTSTLAIKPPQLVGRDWVGKTKSGQIESSAFTNTTSLVPVPSPSSSTSSCPDVRSCQCYKYKVSTSAI